MRTNNASRKLLFLCKVFAVALTGDRNLFCDEKIGLVGAFAFAFQPTGTGTGTSTTMAPLPKIVTLRPAIIDSVSLSSSSSLSSPFSFSASPAVITTRRRKHASTGVLFMEKKGQTDANRNGSSDDDKGKDRIKGTSKEGSPSSSIFWENIKYKPGNLLILPFVALFGIDLLLNIAVLAKRSIEFFVFGQVPSTEPWW